MMCSQCQTGRAWDAQGRCQPCSIGNVNLGPAGSVPAPVRKAGNRPAVVTPMPVRERPKPCSQCCIGVAWDEQGRCRPCSTAGVMLGPAEPEPERPAPDDGAQGEPGDGWWGQLSRRKRKPRD